MPDRGESQGDKWGAAAAAAAAAAGAAAGMTGPLGIVLGAGLAPGLATALRAFGSWYAERQTERVDHMIRTAAKIARLEPDVLVRRMEQTPERAELFVRTFRAAAEASAAARKVRTKSSARSGVCSIRRTRTSGSSLAILAAVLIMWSTRSV